MKKTVQNLKHLLLALIPTGVYILLSAIIAFFVYRNDGDSDGIVDLDFGYSFYLLVILWFVAPLFLLFTVCQWIFLLWKLKKGAFEKKSFILCSILCVIVVISLLVFYLILGLDGFFGIYSGFFNQLFH